MRLLLSAVAAAGSLVFVSAVVAQSTTPATPSTPPQSATASPAVPVNPAAAVPVVSGKRFACQAASQTLRGQERADQLQLCMAQARLDCLENGDRSKDRRPATEGVRERLRAGRAGIAAPVAANLAADIFSTKRSQTVLEAGMPAAVLADIGGRTLVAVAGRGRA